MRIFKLFSYAIAGWVPGGRRHCVLCDRAVWRFMPYERGSEGLPGLMKVLNIVGSDLDHFECPRCGSHDRERHLFLYMHATGMLASLQGKGVLHFAPEKRLSRRLASAQPGRYVRCDLYPHSDDIVRIDMLNMDVDSGSVDLLIANHVLEHVDDYERALSEILRVLRPGGHAILQTPYANGLAATWQDAAIETEEARFHAYGQKDHVRLFGRDIFRRFEAAGFQSCVVRHADALAATDVVRLGINPEEPFFLFRKPE